MSIAVWPQGTAASSSCHFNSLIWLSCLFYVVDWPPRYWSFRQPCHLHHHPHYHLPPFKIILRLPIGQGIKSKFLRVFFIWPQHPCPILYLNLYLLYVFIFLIPSRQNFTMFPSLPYVSNIYAFFMWVHSSTHLSFSGSVLLCSRESTYTFKKYSIQWLFFLVFWTI